MGLVGGCLLWGWWEDFCCGVGGRLSAVGLVGLVGLVGVCLLYG